MNWCSAHNWKLLLTCTCLLHGHDSDHHATSSFLSTAKCKCRWRQPCFGSLTYTHLLTWRHYWTRRMSRSLSSWTRKMCCRSARPRTGGLFIVSLSISASHDIITYYSFSVIPAGANWGLFLHHHYGFVDFSCSCARTSACKTWSVWLLQSPLLV